MNDSPIKDFANDLIAKGIPMEKVIFLSGFKNAVDILEDFEFKGVPPDYGSLKTEFTRTLNYLIEL